VGELWLLRLGVDASIRSDPGGEEKGWCQGWEGAGASTRGGRLAVKGGQPAVRTPGGTAFCPG
jgi:hypothetical protein